MPPSGIRTHDPGNEAATDLRLRTRGHWDQPIAITVLLIVNYCTIFLVINVIKDIKYIPDSFLLRSVVLWPETVASFLHLLVCNMNITTLSS
jgi:hypothetical protein